MITTLEGFYAAVAQLEGALDDEGETAAAESLRTANLGGATSGEVLDRLWFALLSLKRIRSDLAVRIEPLLDFIDSALGPQPHG